MCKNMQNMNAEPQNESSSNVPEHCMPKMACEFMKQMRKNMQEMNEPMADKKPAAKISGLKSEIQTLREEAKKCRQELKEKKKEQKQKQKELKQVKKSVKKSKKKFAAEVVGHLDLQDESTQAPGTYVLKTWKVKNTGTFSWSEETIAAFKKGHKEMVSADSHNVIVGSVAPGEVTYIRAMFAIPEQAGKYTVTFRLQSPEAGKFGAALKTTVFVEGTEEEEEDSIPYASAPVVEEEEQEEAFEYQNQAEVLQSMGFGLEQVKSVLVATQGSTEQALNLLLSN